MKIEEVQSTTKQARVAVHTHIKGKTPENFSLCQLSPGFGANNYENDIFEFIPTLGINLTLSPYIFPILNLWLLLDAHHFFTTDDEISGIKV